MSGPTAKILQPLEVEIQRRIEQKEPPLQQVWATRLLLGGAVYFLLGGREVRAVAAAGVVYYFVQKKVIKEKTEEAKEQVLDTVEELKKKLFGKGP